MKRRLVVIGIAVIMLLLISACGEEYAKPSEEAGNGIDDIDPVYSERAAVTEEECYKFLAMIYGDIDFSINYAKGDRDRKLYDRYKAQFLRLLTEEIPVMEKGRECYLHDLGELHPDMGFPVYDPNHYEYYFYDVDGDDTPELCMTDHQRFIYIFKYDEEADQIVLWDEFIGAMFLMGTGKFGWGAGGGDGLIGLDENGDYTFLARFKVVGSSEYLADGEDGWGYFAALPDAVEPEDWMKEYADYDEIDDIYYFRVTKEQYERLTGAYFAAAREAYEKREEVTYTYAELLGLRNVRVSISVDMGDSGLDRAITVNYPQARWEEDTLLIRQSNDLLKQAAYALFGKNKKEADEELEEWEDLGFGGDTIEYELLYASKEYVSLIYETLSWGGASVVTHHYPVTVDLRTGKYLYLFNVTSAEKVLEAIESGEFTVYEGLWSEFHEEDAHEEEIITLMLEALTDSLKKPWEKDGFDRLSSYNIGLDAEAVYIYFPISEWYSFHGYYILRIPKEVLLP